MFGGKGLKPVKRPFLLETCWETGAVMAIVCRCCCAGAVIAILALGLLDTARSSTSRASRLVGRAPDRKADPNLASCVTRLNDNVGY